MHGNLKRRTNLILDEIIEGKKFDDEIEKIDRYLFGLAKPSEFSGSTGIEVKYIKSFEEICIIISQNINRNAKEMKVLEFYQAWDILKKQFKRASKRNKK